MAGYGLFSVYFKHSGCPQVQGVVSVRPSQALLQYVWPGCTGHRQPGWAQHWAVWFDGVFSEVVMTYLLRTKSPYWFYAAKRLLWCSLTRLIEIFFAVIAEIRQAENLWHSLQRFQKPAIPQDCWLFCVCKKVPSHLFPSPCFDSIARIQAISISSTARVMSYRSLRVKPARRCTSVHGLMIMKRAPLNGPLAVTVTWDYWSPASQGFLAIA
jgi:hypothetical protein